MMYAALINIHMCCQSVLASSACFLKLLMSLAGPYQLWLRTHSHLAEVDGEDGMRAGALGVHLRAGGGAGQSAQLQTLQELRRTYSTAGVSVTNTDGNIYCSVQTVTKAFYRLAQVNNETIFA